MKVKKMVLLVLVLILVGVWGFSFQLIKDTNKTRKKAVVVEAVKHENKVTKTTSSVLTEEVEKKSIFDEEQVVKEDVYPNQTITGVEVSDTILPAGAIVMVKPVEGNDEWVEIDSEPKKGFIKKSNLEPREIYIKTRDNKKEKLLSKTEFKEKTDKDIEAFLAKKGGDVSIYLETVDNTFSYSFYGDELKRTASSIKLPFIAYVMTLADKGEISLDTVLTYQQHNWLDGTGIIQFAEFGTQYTIKQLAEMTIFYSDNVAYLMLLDYVGEANFIQFLKELDPNSPDNRVFSSAKILTEAMEYIYVTKDKSQNMMLLYNWLQESSFDDGVSIGLPGVDVAHKTGWMPMYTVSNDISFVMDEDQPYFLTIMTVGYDDSYSEKSIYDLAKLIDENMLKLDTDK